MNLCYLLVVSPDDEDEEVDLIYFPTEEEAVSRAQYEMRQQPCSVYVTRIVGYGRRMTDPRSRHNQSYRKIDE